ncbi:hypothetical protein [Pseudaestuariivita atlantica]|uniref:hypothetical protein n=1 Tax=Pseudaestuariivita atlantica TaxID=1317121 RepID=UPI00067D3151|nr:hypothetical protein [Pseudaestuariivita atlantica]
MAQNRMIGVVLWCDAAQSKAVIWCEDHGKLAYYTPDHASIHDGSLVDTVTGLDAGDLIRFELSESEQLRFAHNPEVLSDLAYPALANTLKSVRADEGASTPPFDGGAYPAPANSDSVIDFSKAHCARNRATA